MVQDWYIRVGDANNFINSSPLGIWGIQSTTAFGKYFCKNILRINRWSIFVGYNLNIFCELYQ